MGVGMATKKGLLMTAGDAEEFTGLSKKYLRKLVSAGVIECRRLGKRGHRMYVRTQIENIMSRLPKAA